MSREKKYTPGPWHKVHNGSYFEIVVPWEDGLGGDIDYMCPSVASVFESGNQGIIGEPNAHLISAAPDLLEALEACHKELNAHITARNMTAEVDDLHDYQTVHEAAIAIAKAYGGHHE